jgi:hypothetical protein
MPAVIPLFTPDRAPAAPAELGATGQVRVSTSVVHRTDDRATPVAQAHALAGGIDGAQLVLLPGRSHPPGPISLRIT